MKNIPNLLESGRQIGAGRITAGLGSDGGYPAFRGYPLFFYNENHSLSEWFGEGICR